MMRMLIALFAVLFSFAATAQARVLEIPLEKGKYVSLVVCEVKSGGECQKAHVLDYRQDSVTVLNPKTELAYDKQDDAKMRNLPVGTIVRIEVAAEILPQAPVEKTTKLVPTKPPMTHVAPVASAAVAASQKSAPLPLEAKDQKAPTHSNNTKAQLAGLFSDIDWSYTASVGWSKVRTVSSFLHLPPIIFISFILIAIIGGIFAGVAYRLFRRHRRPAPELITSKLLYKPASVPKVAAAVDESPALIPEVMDPAEELRRAMPKPKLTTSTLVFHKPEPAPRKAQILEPALEWEEFQSEQDMAALK